MEAGAWPFLVGGVICLVKSDNERDLFRLNSGMYEVLLGGELRQTVLGASRIGKNTS